MVKRYWVWGLVTLALVLVGCRSVADSPVEAARVAESAPLVESGPATEPPPTAVESGYREEPAPGQDGGFTEQGHPFKGDPSAPIVIEEFSSYQCPFCGKYFRETYPQVMANYVETGQVFYVFHDFPLPTQPQSPLAAEAARCAGRVGGGSAYWAMHDRLLEDQAGWSGRGDAVDIFEGYAGELELDQVAFDGCMDSRATRAQVEADAAEGSKRGVRSTPTFLINGQPLVGAQPYAAFVQVIDAALAEGSVGSTEPSTPSAGPTPAPIVPADDALTLGDGNAPVIIVEFSDYQCSFCACYFQETWPQLKAEFVDTGRVRYVFKDYPIINIHPQASQAHGAARCAGEQGAYWEMHDLVFAGQSEWGSSPDPTGILKGYAAELALDTSAFDACMQDRERWGARLNADLAEGVSLGVRGTPTFFVNGYPLVGAQPYQVFEYVIGLAEQGKLEEALQPQSSTPSPDTALKLAAVSDLSPKIQQLPPTVQEAYRFALANPDVMDKIPCYCGCGSVGHLDNRMCYIRSEGTDGVVFDDHAMG